MSLPLKKSLSGISAYILCSGLLTACGGDGGKSSEPRPIIGTVTVANATDATDNGQMSFDNASCQRDAVKGFFTAAITNGTGLEALKINVKGFTTEPSKTYACKQASDNVTGPVGGLYDNCSVELKKKSPTKPSAANAYGMHRDVAEMDPFTYAGTCTVTITYAAPQVEAKVACTKLVKTYNNDARTNPLNTAVTLDIAEGSTFRCNL